ncbi:TPA: YdcH family protein [Stenotrophomonas maltophilia]|uniref:YdcH family protein n=1 Tax=Stenotrophomonas sp. TaxID=69392 RepID=UPI0028A8B819|nr:YdcH family protein [Stenotrophomonas sp.]HDS0949612.1 YdcH family protein [Stenotrophomonas maltophilia]HDS1027229.1 YdcH family protein [Stenotrophomonas maltophilia]HDS1032243.1 YdcH family protein [Stenotrophomonas maltophilia]HDS1034747.1 YdcH family protein [Stenotrophomonas maltophilia]
METFSPAEIVERLVALRAEHRVLDEQITRMAANGEDDLESKRLKRRKLQLKDCIAKLESLQIPDEPA